MIFFIHYILLTSGLSGTSVLLGVFLQSYSDASQAEIGFLLMTFPFVCLFVKPIFCSLADRYQAHKKYLVISMVLMLIGYSPFVVVPFFKAFCESHKRFCWWLFFWTGQVGNCALGVAWSLGDSLAVNYAHRNGTVYSHMRLMGTVSWGVYGYIIGLINELPFLPKYVPSFLTLYVSVILEIIIILLWNDDDFRMVEPEDSTGDDQIEAPNLDKVKNNSTAKQTAFNDNNANGQFVGLLGAFDKKKIEVDYYDAGQHQMLPIESKKVLDDEDSEDANNNTQDDFNNNSFSKGEENANKNDDNLDFVESKDGVKCPLPSINDKNFELNQETSVLVLNNTKNSDQREEKEAEEAPARERSLSLIKRNYIEIPAEDVGLQKVDQNPKHVNYQWLLFKMIFKVDVRLIKYLIFFALAGFVLAPMSFLFISVNKECEKQADCNFSRLAGYILICQASIETCCFLLVPSLQKLVGNLATLCIGLTSMSLRYLFYSFGYYNTGVSVEWAILGESLHGICFGIYCTLMAEYALSFANQSRLFIPELRKQGLLTEPNEHNKKQVDAEEGEIKVALRATMQATFGGCMDGLGQGMGLLACGLIADHFNYVILWKFFLVVTATTLIGYFLIEISRSKWSDRSRQAKKPIEISNC